MLKASDALLYDPFPHVGERQPVLPVAVRMMGIVAVQSSSTQGQTVTRRQDLAQILQLNKVTTSRAIEILCRQKGWVEERNQQIHSSHFGNSQKVIAYQATAKFWQDRTTADNARESALSDEHNELYQQACDAFAIDFSNDPAAARTTELEARRALWGGAVILLGNQYNLYPPERDVWPEGAAGLALLVKTSVVAATITE